jgi:hypothetical protein
VKTQQLQVDSIAIYGSQARGDADRLSDKDIIVVDSDTCKLSHAKKALEKRGFSCSTYTWNRLHRMQFHGSLFVEHLKREALILRDEKDVLRSFLDSFTPKYDYTADIEATKHTVALTERTSNSPASLGWAYDVLAVAVRNLGVLHLANRGEYSFSYSKILRSLQNDRMITPKEEQVLMELRILKAQYRSGIYHNMPGRQMLESVQKTISKCFTIDFDSKETNSLQLTEKLLKSSVTHPDKYCRLRLAEGAVMAFLPANSADQKSSYRFRRIMGNQNLYGLFHYDLSSEVRREATKIIGQQYRDS